MALTEARPAEIVAGTETRRRSLARRRVKLVLTYLGVALVVALFVIPFLWMVVTSLKTPEGINGPIEWLSLIHI